MPTLQSPPGRQTGPDGVARAKMSWQRAEKIAKQEAARELRAILELLDTGCGPAPLGCCENCRNGLHDEEEDQDGNCTCCGTSVWPD